MKRKYQIIMLLVICVFLLTGCVSSRDRDRIMRLLEKKDIIADDWTQVLSWSTSAAPVPGIASYEFCYKDSDGTEYLISIPSYWNDYRYKEDLLLTVYNDVTVTVEEFEQHSERIGNVKGVKYLVDNKDNYSDYVLTKYNFLLFNWMTVKSYNSE